ncbi:hypothetical protein HDV00_007025 [Rhizophlyctis rosea]|nr:hypothetical protein HDV00_007025 [Rhizophlyctis rosea]
MKFAANGLKFTDVKRLIKPINSTSDVTGTFTTLSSGTTFPPRTGPVPSIGLLAKPVIGTIAQPQTPPVEPIHVQTFPYMTDDEESYQESSCYATTIDLDDDERSWCYMCSHEEGMGSGHHGGSIRHRKKASRSGGGGRAGLPKQWYSDHDRREAESIAARNGGSLRRSEFRTNGLLRSSQTPPPVEPQNEQNGAANDKKTGLFRSLSRSSSKGARTAFSKLKTWTLPRKRSSTLVNDLNDFENNETIVEYENHCMQKDTSPPPDVVRPPLGISESMNTLVTTPTQKDNGRPRGFSVPVRAGEDDGQVRKKPSIPLLAKVRKKSSGMCFDVEDEGKGDGVEGNGAEGKSSIALDDVSIELPPLGLDFESEVLFETMIRSRSSPTPPLPQQQQQQPQGPSFFVSSLPSNTSPAEPAPLRPPRTSSLKHRHPTITTTPSTTSKPRSPPRLPVTPQTESFEVDVMLEWMMGEVGGDIWQGGRSGSLGMSDGEVRSKSLPRGLGSGLGGLGTGWWGSDEEGVGVGGERRTVVRPASPPRPKSMGFAFGPVSSLSPPTLPAPLPPPPAPRPFEGLQIPLPPRIPDARVGMMMDVAGAGAGVADVVVVPNALPVLPGWDGGVGGGMTIGSGSGSGTPRTEVWERDGRVEVGVKRERSNDDLLVATGGGVGEGGNAGGGNARENETDRQPATLGRTVKRFLRRPSMPNLRELF